jgi:magnesium transporter
LVGGFEEMLQAHISLAFFMPGVVYLADAVGTQTETVVVRGLSVGVPMRQMGRNEAFTGFVAGLILALCFLPIGLLLAGGGAVAMSVAIALLAACVIATGIGLILPRLLQRAGWDPAFGTGPLSTVLQDFFSIAVYLAVAKLLTS